MGRPKKKEGEVRVQLNAMVSLTVAKEIEASRFSITSQKQGSGIASHEGTAGLSKGWPLVDLSDALCPSSLSRPQAS